MKSLSALTSYIGFGLSFQQVPRINVNNLLDGGSVWDTKEGERAGDAVIDWPSTPGVTYLKRNRVCVSEYHSFQLLHMQGLIKILIRYLPVSNILFLSPNLPLAYVTFYYVHSWVVYKLIVIICGMKAIVAYAWVLIIREFACRGLGIYYEANISMFKLSLKNMMKRDLSFPKVVVK